MTEQPQPAALKKAELKRERRQKRNISNAALVGLKLETQVQDSK